MSKEEYEGKCSAPTSPFTAENDELLEERGMLNRSDHLIELDNRCAHTRRQSTRTF